MIRFLPFDDILVNNVLTLGVGHGVEHPAEAGGQRAVLEVVDVCELLLDPGLELPPHGLVVLLGALREQILGSAVKLGPSTDWEIARHK